jgi:TonB family protein
MFDKLIESDTAGAEFKSRRRYFFISTVVVGLLFVSAVVVSLYAADVGLGDDTYELSAIVAPVTPPAESPEPPQPRREQNAAPNHSNESPSRIIAQQPIDRTPVSVPPISITPNRYESLPKGSVKINGTQSDGGSPIGNSQNGDTAASNDTGSTGRNEIVDERPPKTELPPAPAAPRPKPTQSLGVINGRAAELPKPAYPAPAMAMRIEGKVDVEVTIDETGRVISAHAASGHPLLRQAAESAAWKARFSPTYLSKVPVKVTGVIVYNFARN